MITIKDIAEHVGVATSTVSYALNNDPRIPDETKHKIFVAARELGYTGKSGKKSGQGYLKQLVLCINSISGEIYTELMTSMRNVLNVSNCELLVYVGTNISRIKWMDGLFVLNSQVSNQEITEVANRHIPIVLMDRDIVLNCAVKSPFSRTTASGFLYLMLLLSLSNRKPLSVQFFISSLIA